MLSYILKRVLATVPVMIIVAVFVFLLLRLTPGDPAAILAGMPQRQHSLSVFVTIWVSMTRSMFSSSLGPGKCYRGISGRR